MSEKTSKNSTRDMITGIIGIIGIIVICGWVFGWWGGKKQDSTEQSGSAKTSEIKSDPKLQSSVDSLNAYVKNDLRNDLIAACDGKAAGTTCDSTQQEANLKQITEASALVGFKLDENNLKTIISREIMTKNKLSVEDVLGAGNIAVGNQNDKTPIPKFANFDINDPTKANLPKTDVIFE